MYTKRIQIENYGPIDQLDITLPFEGDAPKPIVLVGENGSGKSILLSQIVNGLICAQGVVYPDTPEVETGKVYKLRNNAYIKSGREFYFSRVDFEDNLFIEELRSLHSKGKDSVVPSELTGVDAQNAWQNMRHNQTDHADSSFFGPSQKNRDKIEGVFSQNCILYFPSNRFEEPAWLNEENLNAKASYMDSVHLKGHTNRKVINYSPLRDNQNWLFEVAYDRHAFEVQTTQFPVNITDQNQKPHSVTLPLFIGFRGAATNIYDSILSVVRSVLPIDGNLQFGIGVRQHRIISIIQGDEVLVPNIFQLSSGETSLLNLFLSILRDFDLCGASFAKPEEIRGIVIVDEVDLHLHAIHQYTILPELIKMFPRVQFIMTTHSPLFVLGMQRTFGDEGIVLYSLPQGQQISPEEFSEFGNAYQSFSETQRFLDDLQQAIEDAQKPIVFLDGKTDIKYLEKAAELLGKQSLLEKIQLWDGEGHGNLYRVWDKFDSKISEIVPQKVILINDCDKPGKASKGKVFKRSIPKQEDHPLDKGIENLFSKATLEKAIKEKPQFVDIVKEHSEIIRGKEVNVAEKWSVVNKDEKTNLCHWLCENGTVDDFGHFQVVFGLLEDMLGEDEDIIEPMSPKQPQLEESTLQQ